MAPVLGYWNIRGLAQSIRLLLAYVGEDYEEEFYQFGPAPDYDKSEWLNDRNTLGLILPNLPYYIDGDIKITQSNAILRHIGRKHNLCGTTEKEKVIVDILENHATDMRMGYVRLCYMNYNAQKAQYFENLRNTLRTLAEVLGDQPWFAGSNITIADFLLYELFDCHRVLEPSSINNFPTLKAYLTRFEELPDMKKYMASSRFMAVPLNGPMAKAGNK